LSDFEGRTDTVGGVDAAMLDEALGPIRPTISCSR
jgi:hypothetical protein